jgi:hypothetical protein
MNTRIRLAPYLGGTPLAFEGSEMDVCTLQLQIPVHRGQSFRRIADSIPVIADSFS